MENKLLEKLIQPFKYWSIVKLNICLHAHESHKRRHEWSSLTKAEIFWHDFFPLEWMQVRRRQKKKRKPNLRVVNLIHNPVGKWDENDMLFYCTWSLFEILTWILSSVKCTDDTNLHNFDLTCSSGDKIETELCFIFQFFQKIRKKDTKFSKYVLLKYLGIRTRSYKTFNKYFFLLWCMVGRKGFRRASIH